MGLFSAMGRTLQSSLNFFVPSWSFSFRFECIFSSFIRIITIANCEFDKCLSPEILREISFSRIETSLTLEIEMRMESGGSLTPFTANFRAKSVRLDSRDSESSMQQFSWTFASREKKIQKKVTAKRGEMKSGIVHLRKFGGGRFRETPDALLSPYFLGREIRYHYAL